VVYFDKNKLRLIDFVEEYKLKEVVLPIYDRALNVYQDGKDKVVEIYGNRDKITLENINN